MEDEHTFDKFVSEIQEKGWTLTNYEDHYKFSNHSRITGLPFAVNVVMDTEYNMNILAEELQSRCEAFDIDEYVRERLNAKAEGASGIPNTDILVEEGTDIEDMLTELSDIADTYKNNEIEYLGTLHQVVENDINNFENT